MIIYRLPAIPCSNYPHPATNAGGECDCKTLGHPLAGENVPGMGQRYLRCGCCWDLIPQSEAEIRAQEQGQTLRKIES